MNRLKRIPADWVAIGLLLFLSLIFFSNVLFTDKVFFAGDNLSINVPSKVLFLRMLARGQLPLWNPYTFAGTPFLADINLGLLSPFNIFYLLASPLRALTISIITAITLAGVGSYFYARKININRPGSLVAAAVFMFSGSLMTHILNTAVLNTIVWLPLILLLLESLFQEQKLKYSLLTSITLALSLFGGHIQYFYYILLLSLGYILVQPFSWKRKAVYVAYVYIPMLFLTAVQWVPFLQYASYSTRPQQSLGYAGSVPLVSFIQLLLPNFFGIVKDGTSWGATANINGYVGIVPFLLAVSALFGSKSRLVWFFLAVALVSLLLALGSHSPLYLLAFHALPFFSRFRSPAGILVVYSFSLAILSGISVQHFKKIKLPLLILFGSAALLVLSFFLNDRASAIVLPLMVKLNRIKQTAFVTRFLEYSAERDRVIFSLWFENLALVFFSLFSFTLFVFLRMRNVISSRALHFLLFFLIVSDLFFFSGNNNIISTEKQLQTPPAISELFRKDTSSFRVLTYTDPGAKPPFADPGYFEEEAVKALDILHPNTNIFADVESIGGYASIVRKDYAAYISTIKTTDPTGISLPKPGSKQVNELNVKYILTAGSEITTLSAVPYYKPVLAYNDSRIRRTVTVFENGHVLPRTFLVNKNGLMNGSATIVGRNPTEITVATQATAASTLVLSEMSYPGWRVTVDDKPAKLEEYHGIFRSVKLPSGKHSVIFSFIPFTVCGAALLSIVNWIYILVFLAFLLGKKHKKVGKELHVGEPEVKQDA